MISKGGYHGNDNRDGEKGYTLIQKEGKDYVNGVDLTDNLRAFNKQEYFKLPQAYCTMLHNLPERHTYKKNRISDTSTTSTTSVTLQSSAQANIGAIVNGVMQASAVQGNSVPPTNIRIPRFGGSSTISSVQYNIPTNVSDTSTYASIQSSLFWVQRNNASALIRS